MIISTKNIIIIGSDNRPMLTDVFFDNSMSQKAIIIYAHGFNGFKDWGNFDLIANQFAAAGFVFVKFNFSHNGTTVDQPEDFADTEAFGNNNYSKQLEDLGRVIDWCLSPGNSFFPREIHIHQIYLLGHSMGGGIVLLKAAEEARVNKVATWAAIGECKTPWGSWPQEKINDWRKTGVSYYANSRTKQQLPLYFQLYEDYQDNRDRLNIKSAISKLKIPVLLCHGSNDEAVLVETVKQLHSHNSKAKLFIVESDHVFGRKHPWTGTCMPAAMQAVIDKTIQFFQ